MIKQEISCFFMCDQRTRAKINDRKSHNVSLLSYGPERENYLYGSTELPSSV